MPMSIYFDLHYKPPLEETDLFTVLIHGNFAYLVGL
jgi:hypothetical protein